MADSSCISFASKPFSSFSPFIPHYTHSRSFFIFPAPPFNRSNLYRKKGSQRKHLTCLCTPNSQNLDVVSTHEHTDGSVVFRFGDPSEVVESDLLSETNLEHEAKHDEDNGKFNVVKVLDGDHKREVIVKKIDREVKSNDSAEVVDEANTAVASSGSIDVSEKEEAPVETLTSTNNNVERPVRVSVLKGDTSSGSIAEVEDVESMDMEVAFRSSSVDVEMPVSISGGGGNESSESTDELEDVGRVEMNVASGSSSVTVSLSSMDEYKYSESIAEIEGVTREEKKIEINEYSSSSQIEDAVHIEKSSIDTNGNEILSASDHISGPEDQEVPLETHEPIIDSVSLHETASVEQNPVDQSLTDVHAKTSQENPEVDHSSPDADALDVESGILNDIGGEKGIGEAIEIKPLSLPLEAEPILNEEAGLDTLEESAEAEGSENKITITKTSESVLEMEMTNGMAGDKELFDVSGSEVLELKSSGSELQSEEIPIAKLFLNSGASLLESPQKVLAGGEDAYFTCQNWLGVADGVGLWSLEGTSRGVYAKELMGNCQKVVSDCKDVPITSPEELLNQAVAKAKSSGSSTVLVGHFDGQALHVANIGDTRFIILRNNATCHRSSPMLHEFNFPVQVVQGDDPSKLIESYRTDLQEGDVVVIGTDGLFDNLYEQEIVSTVSNLLEADKNPSEIAETLAMRAQEMGRSTSTRTPFADAAQAAGCGGFTGGRLDDVAVIVSLVGKDSKSPVI